MTNSNKTLTATCWVATCCSNAYWCYQNPSGELEKRVTVSFQCRILYFFTIGIHVPHTHTAIFCTAIASTTVVVASMINLIAGPLNVILYICVLCAFLTVYIYIYKSRIIKVTHAPPSHHQTILRLKAMRLPQSPTAKRAFDVMSLSLWQQCSREK